MKNTTRIFISVSLLAVLLIAQTAYASWWNPFSWFKSNTQKVEVTTNPFNVGPLPAISEDHGIECNGKYYEKCSPGSNFYCPSEGDAECLPNAVTSVSAPSGVTESSTDDYYKRAYQSLEDYKRKSESDSINSELDLQRELDLNSKKSYAPLPIPVNCTSTYSSYNTQIYTHCE